MNLELTGKNVVVTGGSTGIGLAVAKGFLGEGAHVAIIGRDRAKLDAALAELRTAGPGRVSAEPGDVTKASDAPRLH